MNCLKQLLKGTHVFSALEELDETVANAAVTASILTLVDVLRYIEAKYIWEDKKPTFDDAMDTIVEYIAEANHSGWDCVESLLDADECARVSSLISVNFNKEGFNYKTFLAEADKAL